VLIKHHRTQQSLQHLLQKYSLYLLITAIPALSVADDIEVYLQPPQDPIPPNVLFLLDESASMDTQVASGLTRRDALVNALHNIVNMGVMDNVNAALLGYTTSDREEHPTIRLIAHTGDFSIVDENRASFSASIDQLQALNYTPTTDALAAAVDWFNPERTPDLIQNGNLTSPLSGDPETGKCAPNRIVLLSDGAPNTSTRSTYEGTVCEEVHLFDNFEENDPQWYNRGARCAREISAWAYRTDLATDPDWEGVQNILTYTLTFGAEEGSLTKQFMDGVAAAGGGESWLVENEEDLEAAFFEIIEDTRQSVAYAMNAPAIPFNPDNAAVNGEFIYVPLFYPETRRFWRGNLKKYRIRVSDDDIQLLASGGHRVLNNDHTFASTVDLFCDRSGCPADQGEPLNGGAARNMTGPRELYTNLDPAQSLDGQANRVHRETVAITTDLLDVGTEEERIELLNWITRDSAYVATPEQPAHNGVMGAPIHTQPLVVNYAGGEIVYLPTSEGVLEAIDADSGRELWAFMPRDLLRNIRQIRNNEPSTVPYYGLDGPLTVYEIGGSKMAIVGMRRGGRKYHMLDITDPDEPEYVSEISGESSPSEFDKLGQTWSKPLFVKMWINGAEREVLIFGGGYDPDQDNADPNTEIQSDDEGNAIYIVDASDGTLLRSVSNTGASLNISGMDNAIPSNLATVDINGNGIVDRIYAADVGGRIIRVDFPDGDAGGGAPSGGIVADINQGSDANRKFFTTPQVGYYARGIHQFLVLLIGTGDHAHPLDSDITDRFYMIKDGNIWNQVSDYETAVDNDFIPATDTALVNGQVLNDGSKGWYIGFTGSEKSYSRAILYDYAIFFTTYRADRVIPDESCQVASTTGSARIYGIDLISANAAIDWNGESDAPLSLSDRSTELELQGIPPSPMLIFPGGVDANGNPEIGKKIFLFSDLEKKYEWSDRFRPIYWEEVLEH
jgi:type IV pilus assembly protein PilY1